MRAALHKNTTLTKDEVTYRSVSTACFVWSGS